MHATRRRLIATLGGGLSAGGVALLAMTGRTQAAVSTDSLTIGDATFASPDGAVYSPVIDVTAAFEYSNADAAARTMTAMLIDGTLVDDVTAPTAAGSDSGTRGESGIAVRLVTELVSPHPRESQTHSWPGHPSHFRYKLYCRYYRGIRLLFLDSL
jgi:hypothetical protein